MNKIVIAPDSFKGTLSSVEVCRIISKALKEKYPGCSVKSIPVADGGEGTCEAFLYALGGEKITCSVKSPLGRDIKADYALLKDGSAVIEMAAASGLTLEKQNDALLASSFGTGQLMLHAVQNGCKRIILGIGGSATTDGGMGCMAALGVKFYDKDKREINACGKNLSDVCSIDSSCLEKLFSKVKIQVLCDVSNPLFGKKGAAFVYSPQKGANEAQVQFLDKGLCSFANAVARHIGEDFSGFPGAGAAGGMGFAMKAFLSAELKRGIDCVLDSADFDSYIKDCELVITGEGKMDSQSLMGKVPFGVAERSKGVPVLAIVGLNEADSDMTKKLGISRIIETNPLHLPFDEIKDKASEMLYQAAKRI